MGAGVIPFTINESTVLFLFQTTFSGRKAGHLIDFGGGIAEGESYRETAIREFVEETETLYFTDDIHQARRSQKGVNGQIPQIENLFEKTLSLHPDWWRQRASGNALKPKLWKTFFIEFPYRNIEELNREWQADKPGRFKKRRQLFWITADELLSIYQHHPEKLWKRVRQLENVVDLIHVIQQHKIKT